MDCKEEILHFSQSMREDLSEQYLRWRTKWDSEYWDDSDSDAKRSFLDYAIDDSFTSRFGKHKWDDMDDDIPRMSLLSETIDSLDRLNECGTLDGMDRRAIEDFLLVLAWYEDEDCVKNDFWKCLNDSEVGLEGVARKALEFLNEGVELKPFTIEISGREDVESMFGISSFRRRIRKMVSERRFVTPSGRFSTTAASSAISKTSFRCSDFVEEEIVKKICGCDIEGKISTFKVNCSRRQVLRMAEIAGWREPSRGKRDSVNQHLERRMKERLGEKRRWRKNAIRLSKLLGRRRAFDLVSQWSWVEELVEVRKENWKTEVDGRGLLRVHQQRYNAGNIAFSTPVDWDDDTGVVMDSNPIFGHYRTRSYMKTRALKDEDVPAKPSSWYRYDPIWGEYNSETEENEKCVIDTGFKFLLLNHKQKESLKRYNRRIEGFLTISLGLGRWRYVRTRSPYPLFLPLGNAIRDMQNFWKERSR